MLEQLAIACFGVAAVWLSQDSRESVRRWACVIGLLAQPWWFIATWKANQAGMFFLCFLYSAAWLRGVWQHWLAPQHPYSLRDRLAGIRKHDPRAKTPAEMLEPIPAIDRARLRWIGQCKAQGCAHVDGPLCAFPQCSLLAEWQHTKENSK